MLLHSELVQMQPPHVDQLVLSWSGVSRPLCGCKKQLAPLGHREGRKKKKKKSPAAHHLQAQTVQCVGYSVAVSPPLHVQAKGLSRSPVYKSSTAWPWGVS